MKNNIETIPYENEVADDGAYHYDRLYDLCSIYDFRDDPPPGLFDEWEIKAYNPFIQTIMRKIGNTWYLINTDCGGKETLVDKVKRLIMTDPMPERAVITG